MTQDEKIMLLKAKLKAENDILKKRIKKLGISKENNV